MARKAQASSSDQLKSPSPARGLLFVAGSLGLFYTLISIVDPLL